MITSVSGVVIPTITVPYNAAHQRVYAATWFVPGGSGHQRRLLDASRPWPSRRRSTQATRGSSPSVWNPGPPAAVTNLTADGGGRLGQPRPGRRRSPTTSPTTRSYRTDRPDPRTAVDGTRTLVAGGPPQRVAAFVATGFTDAGLTKDVTYTYEVYAVDQVGKRSDARDGTARTGVVQAAQPAPATDLAATYSGGTAVLTWLASPTVGVAGYRVYKNGDTDTWVATVSGPYCDLAQGYDTDGDVPGQALLTGSVLASRPSPPLRRAGVRGRPTAARCGPRWLSLSETVLHAQGHEQREERQDGPHHAQVPRPRGQEQRRHGQPVAEDRLQHDGVQGGVGGPPGGRLPVQLGGERHQVRLPPGHAHGAHRRPIWRSASHDPPAATQEGSRASRSWSSWWRCRSCSCCPR